MNTEELFSVCPNACVAHTHDACEGPYTHSVNLEQRSHTYSGGSAFLCDSKYYKIISCTWNIYYILLYYTMKLLYDRQRAEKINKAKKSMKVETQS